MLVCADVSFTCSWPEVSRQYLDLRQRLTTVSKDAVYVSLAMQCAPRWLQAEQVRQHVLGSLLSFLAHSVYQWYDDATRHSLCSRLLDQRDNRHLLALLTCAQTTNVTAPFSFTTNIQHCDTHRVFGEMLPDGLALQVTVFQMIFRHAHCSNMASAKPTAACAPPPIPPKKTAQKNYLSQQSGNADGP